MNTKKGEKDEEVWGKAFGGKGSGIITTSWLFYNGLLSTNNRLFSKAGVLAMENEAAVLFVIDSVGGLRLAASWLQTAPASSSWVQGNLTIIQSG